MLVLTFSEQMQAMHSAILRNKALVEKDIENYQRITSNVKDKVFNVLKQHSKPTDSFRIDEKLFSKLIEILEDQEEKSLLEEKFDEVAAIVCIFLNMPLLIVLKLDKELDKLLSDTHKKPSEKGIDMLRNVALKDSKGLSEVLFEVFIKEYGNELKKISEKQQLDGIRTKIKDQEIVLPKDLEKFLNEKTRELLQILLENAFSKSPSKGFDTEKITLSLPNKHAGIKKHL